MAEHPELSAAERAGKAFPVSWDQFHRDCRALTWRLNEVGPFHAVIAITRGGLVPAAIVARELGVRVIDTVCIASYDHTKQGDLKVLKGISDDTAHLGGGNRPSTIFQKNEFLSTTLLFTFACQGTSIR